MKTTIFSLVLVLQSSILFGQFLWKQKTDYGGPDTYFGFSFVIDNKAYVGGTKQMWEYNNVTDQWTQKANLPIQPYWVHGFSIDRLGYIIVTIMNTTQVWQYSPATNQWLQKKDFPGETRPDGIAFNIGNKGYYGLGLNASTPYKNDFWEYNPANDQWTQKSNLPIGRRAAMAFTIGLKGYVGLGDTSKMINDFWEYDPSTNIWTQKANFGGASRQFAVGFSIGNNGYVGTGLSNTITYLNDFWKYNSLTDSWEQIANMPAPTRQGAVAFTLNNKGYVTTGYNGSRGVKTYNDLWEYTPTTSLSNASFIASELSLFPNPTIGNIEIKSEKDVIVTIKIINSSGQEVLNKNNINENNLIIDLTAYSKGIYSIEIIGNSFISKEKIIVE